MKSKSFSPMSVGVASFLIHLGLQTATAQFDIDWFKAADGGGTSTGGAYSVNGTVGQSDAGEMTGGQYDLVGGFWGAIDVVPTASSPTLTITRTTTNTILVCWSSPLSGFTLEQTRDLNRFNWTAVPQTPVDDGTTKCITVSPFGNNVFFRLRKQLAPAEP